MQEAFKDSNASLKILGISDDLDAFDGHKNNREVSF